jgi:hypothetical protein
LAAVRLMPVASREDDQLAEPLKTMMPSGTPPLVWLIWLVADSPTGASLSRYGAQREYARLAERSR